MGCVMGDVYVFFRLVCIFRILFYLFEIEGESTSSGERQREREKQTPGSAGSLMPMPGLIPGP